MKVSASEPPSSNNPKIDSYNFAHRCPLRHSTDMPENALGQVVTESSFMHLVFAMWLVVLCFVSVLFLQWQHRCSCALHKDLAWVFSWLLILPVSLCLVTVAHEAADVFRMAVTYCCLAVMVTGSHWVVLVATERFVVKGTDVIRW